MSQQQTASKPSLSGVKIRARKGAVKAQAKYEPAAFRDQLYKHLETVPQDDFESITAKLIQAGSTLEFAKYADALFEVILAGGLIQPGGTYVDDGAPRSPFTIFNAQDPAQVDELKKYVDVMNKLIRRYKYLQKPLETSTLPGLLQYIHRWDSSQKDKLAITISLLMSQGLASASCLSVLTKDHLVKDDVSVSVITTIFRTYLADQSMEHLSGALKKGGIKNLLDFFPAARRESKVLDEHFRKEGLPQVANWYTKRQMAALRDGLIKELKDLISREESTDTIISAIQARQEEQPLADAELIQCIWAGLMQSIDWSTRADQIEGLALREVSNFAPILEPFCNGPKTEVTLINTVQVFCYEDTRVMKAFPQILKVLYNKDCISDQAIIYWHQKGAKPQGKQHFLKATESLVKFLQEQESEDEE